MDRYNNNNNDNKLKCKNIFEGGGDAQEFVNYKVIKL